MDPKHLGTLRTLGEIIEYLQGSTASSSAASESSAAGVAPAGLPSSVTETGTVSKAAVGRFALRVVPAPAAGLGLAGLGQARRIAITEDGRGVAGALAKLFQTAGYAAEAATAVPNDADAVISLAALRPAADESAAIAVNREAFAHAQAVAGRFSGDDVRGIFVTVQDLGGDFGLASLGQNLDRIDVYRGGVAGLAKTAAREWPGAVVKAIDVAGRGRSPEEVARALFDELTAGGLETEVGLLEDGSRVTLKSYADELNDFSESGDFVNQNSVIVATGGARGVTAHTLVALAKNFRPRLALLGRTPLVEEAENLRGITDDARLKRALLEAAKSRGEKLTPVDLNREAGRIQANRDIRKTLEALRAAGSEARYFACDVKDEVQLGKVLDEIRSAWGPVTGLLHGAGVLADKLIAEKTSEQFDRVFDTKVEGMRTLFKATKDDPLSYICFFSSVAARAGNAGQCDYAMANEILNKVAGVEARRRGPDCLVKSMNWG
ncbi:MAG: SDR family NAD(P)-dependent oxidoreductase, partial [Leptospirales bacterium]